MPIRQLVNATLSRERKSVEEEAKTETKTAAEVVKNTKKRKQFTSSSRSYDGVNVSYFDLDDDDYSARESEYTMDTDWLVGALVQYDDQHTDWFCM